MPSRSNVTVKVGEIIHVALRRREIKVRAALRSLLTDPL